MNCSKDINVFISIFATNKIKLSPTNIQNVLSYLESLRMKKILCTVFLAFILISFNAFADENIIKIISIHDGDTLTAINDNNKKVKIRLFGIDAPETTQKYGQASRDYLRRIVKGKNLSYKIRSHDDYGRVVATLYGNGKDLNYEMIKAGYAWHYKHYNKSKEYADAEKNARKQKIGLWKGANPQAPWEYRRENKQNNNDDMEDLMRSLLKAAKYLF